jgi:hypothetical protein
MICDIAGVAPNHAGFVRNCTPRRGVQRLASIWTSIALLACASHITQPTRTATPEEEAQMYPELHFTVSNQEPGPGCEFLSVVTASEGDESDPYQGLRERALALRGNYLVPDASRASRLTWGYRVAYEARGRVFRCAAIPAVVRVAPAPIPAIPTCEPECSPGFTCVRGTCVSACNPPCSSDQRCLADRLCHSAE